MELLEQHFDAAFAAPDGIKKLRELILTLAMQGKLAPQDPNDPPASQLLQEIDAEKKRLIKEGKIKAPQPLHKIKTEGIPYALPKGWSWTTLQEVAIINPRNSAADSMEVSFIPMTLIGTSYDGAHGQERRAWENVKQGYTHFAEGDIGVAKITPCFENGKACIFSDLTNGLGAGTTELHIVRPVGQTISSRYILAYLRSPRFLRVGETKMTGTAGQKRLPKAFVESHPFPFPPLAEQHRIVAIIDQLMVRCDDLEKLLAEREQKRRSVHTAALNQLLDAQSSDSFTDAWQFIVQNFGELYADKENVAELRKAILQLAVMGKLVPQNPNDPPASQLLKEIEAEKKKLVKEGKIKAPKPLPAIKEVEVPYLLPLGWKWVRIRGICHDWGQKIPDGRFTYIDIGSINNKIGAIGQEVQTLEAREAPSRARKLVREGTVIYSTVRPYLLNIAIIEDEYEYEPIASTAFAILHPFGGINNRFIYSYLRSPVFIKYVESKMKGVAYPAINDGDFFLGILPLPSLPEQNRIVTKIDQLMALCDTLEQKIHASTAKQTELLNSVMAQV